MMIGLTLCCGSTYLRPRHGNDHGYLSSDGWDKSVRSHFAPTSIRISSHMPLTHTSYCWVISNLGHILSLCDPMFSKQDYHSKRHRSHCSERWQLISGWRIRVPCGTSQLPYISFMGISFTSCHCATFWTHKVDAGSDLPGYMWKSPNPSRTVSP